MRRLVAIALPLALVSGPALAQPAPEEAPVETEAFDRMAEKLSDPEMQRTLAAGLAMMSDVLLDMPLAPVIAPLAEATGQDISDIPPDASLRDLAPESGDIARRIERDMPRAMDRMADMSAAFAAMMPALADMAKTMEGAMADAVGELPRR